MTTLTRIPTHTYGYLIVTVPITLGAGSASTAHRSAHYSVSVDSDGVTWVGGSPHGTVRQSFVRPACQPAPAEHDTAAARGWFECTAAWADHRGARACPDCFPSEDAEARA